MKQSVCVAEERVALKSEESEADSLDGLDADLDDADDNDAEQAEKAAAARSEAEAAAWTAALQTRSATRDFTREAVESLKTATATAKRSKGDPGNVPLASETALAWVTADRLITLALESPDASEKHKAALGGKHETVRKKLRSLTAEAMSSAEAAYDAAEKDAVKDEVARAMAQ